MSGPLPVEVVAEVVVRAGVVSTGVLGVALVGQRALGRTAASAAHALGAVAVLSVLPLAAMGAAAGCAHTGLVVPWAVGAGALLLRRAALEVALRRCVRAGVRSTDARWIAADVPAPLTLGFLRPVVVLPRGAAAGLTSAQLDAVLAHERAHIRRGDWLVGLLVDLVVALLWFQPLVWLARRRLAALAEHAVDDVVVAGGTAPSLYAGLLLRFQGSAQPAPGLGGSLVGRRVHAILARRPRRLRRWPAATAAVLAIATSAPLWRALPALAPPAPTCQPTELP